MLARFNPVIVLGLTALGLLIGGVSPAWWITGLVALGLGLAMWTGTSVFVSGRMLYLAPYFPAMVIGLAAAGLLVADASPAWWITALVAAGMMLNLFMSTRLPSR